GEVLFAFLLRVPGSRRLSGGFELVAECALVDPGSPVSEIAQLLQLFLAEITGKREPNENIGNLVLRRLFQLGLRGAEIVFQLINCAAVREAVDPQGAIGSAQDLCLSGTVKDAFDRGGGGCVLKSAGVRQPLGDSSARQIL